MMKLWYTREAGEWTQALPIGNGHLGAMCYGGASGRFDLSENTCWSGKAQPCPLRAGAAEAMEKARSLLLAGEYDAADALLEGCTGVKGNYGTQVPLGKLRVALEAQPVSQSRTLELETGLALDVLTLDGAQVTRESFASNPDKVMAVRMTAHGERRTFCLWTEGWIQPCRTVGDRFVYRPARSRGTYGRRRLGCGIRNRVGEGGAQRPNRPARLRTGGKTLCRRRGSDFLPLLQEITASAILLQ